MGGDSSTPPSEVIIRCMCGQRYRIRDAKAGMRTRCPECDSLVEVTEADLDTSFSSDGLINLHVDQAEAQPAILVSDDEVRLAGKGSRPGVTGKVTHTNEEALLATALGGRSAASFNAAARGTVAPDDSPVKERTFIDDLLFSFWCAGSRRNAQNIVLTAMPLAVLSVITPMIPFPFSLFVVVPLLIVFIWIIQFYWQVLQTTTRGEDEIPWFELDWNLWDDVVRPLWWVAWTSLVCSMPCMWVFMYLPHNPTTAMLAWALLAGGWFFWPVAVMSYALGRSFAYLRPDWLVRCIYGIGPVYFIAWALVMGTMAAWIGCYLGVHWLSDALANYRWWVTALAVFVVSPLAALADLYFGYVVFRMIGLLFRHYRTRFPWKF